MPDEVVRTMPDASDDVDSLLRDARGGDRAAVDALTTLVYTKLRRIAAGYLRRERPNHTLQPTALVHEAYFRLVGQRDVEWQNRAHFLGVAAQEMRRILVDYARRRGRRRRPDALQRVSLSEVAVLPAEFDVEIIALDTALRELSEKAPRAASVVELRFFGGLTPRETAEVLGISRPTADRDFAMAREWLLSRLRGV
jgi:RNA polymerase sigma-70 factor, ECF subfamily